MAEAPYGSLKAQGLSKRLICAGWGLLLPHLYIENLPFGLLSQKGWKSLLHVIIIPCRLRVGKKRKREVRSIEPSSQFDIASSFTV